VDKFWVESPYCGKIGGVGVVVEVGAVVVVEQCK